MSSFFCATSAQRRASLRASSSPSACSRTIWISANDTLLQFAMTLFLGQLRQLLRGIIEPAPVAAVRAEQRLEAGHQFVVRRLRAEEGIVRLVHPAIVATPLRRIETRLLLHLRVLAAELRHELRLRLRARIGCH